MKYEKDLDEDDWAYIMYGTNDPEKIVEISEAESHGYEAFRINQLVNLIKKGKKPKVRDIAYVLRTYSRVVWPKEFREYTADLLMKKAGESTKGTIFSDDGVTWKNDAVLDEFKRLAYVDAVDFLISKNMNKVEAMSVLARAHEVGLLDLEQLYYDSIKGLALSEVERLWEKDEGLDMREKSAEKRVEWLNKIYYQRNR